jgi:hypothetical protein
VQALRAIGAHGFFFQFQNVRGNRYNLVLACGSKVPYYYVFVVWALAGRGASPNPEKKKEKERGRTI